MNFVRYALLTLMIMVLAQTAMSQSVAFKIPISVKDARGHTGTMYFGVHPNATYCIDTLLCDFYDQTCITEGALPPENTLCDTCFEWRFVDTRGFNSDCMDLGIDNDIRHFTDTTQVDTFQIQFKSNFSSVMYPLTFHWPKTLSYYADSMKFRDGLGLGFDLFPPANMLTVDSIKITNSALKLFRVYMYGPKPLPPLLSPPLLTSPSDNATGQSQTVTLNWSLVSGAGQYRLQVSTDSLFSSFVFNDTLFATSKQISGLSELAKYYWHVSALNVLGVGTYQSAPFRFSTSGNAPALVSPPDNQTNIPTSTTLTWNKGSYTAQYQLQVSTDQAFATTFLDVSAIAETTKAVNGLSNCTPYYWRVKASNANGVTPYSSARKFTVAEATPSVPVLVSPASDQNNVALSPTLSWTGDICAQTYTLQVRLDDSTSGTLVFNSSVGTASQALSNLRQRADYYWRVNAANDAGTSAFTEYRKFTTILFPPAVPTLKAPADGGTVNPSATFSWVSNPYADSYRLQVSQVSNFSSTFFDDSTITDSTQLVSGLVNCVTYYWRVNAKNTAGTSAFSASRNVNVIESVPTVPVLDGPTDNEINVGFDTTLTWHRTDVCSKSYRIQLALDSNFTILVYNDSTVNQSFNVVGLQGLTDYYWHVRAVNPTGQSAYSSFFRFKTTGNTPPSKPTLLTPLNGQGDVLMNPTLTWQTAARATSYRLQVALDTAFTILVVNDSTITTTSDSIGPLLNSTCYYWRVNAKNTEGTSAFSDTWKFCTLYPPSTPVAIVPLDGASHVSVTTNVQWSLADRADLYHLQVARGSDFTNLQFEDSTLASPNWSFAAHPLGSNRMYCWRARAKNASGWGSWSSTACFTTEYSGVADFTIALAVSETGPARDTLRFGIKPGATMGIDPSIGEFELPPRKFGMFDTRFIGSLLGEGIVLSIHPFVGFTQVDTFMFEFQPGIGSYPIQLSWSTSAVQEICDSMLLVDNFGGNTTHVWMNISSSISITNVNVSSLNIIEYGAKPKIVDVKQPEVVEIPKGFMLYQNYPNPFNPTTQVQFSTDHRAQIRVAVYDVLGREMTELANGMYSEGIYTLTWDGRNRQGSSLPSGVYYVRMLGKAVFEGNENEQYFSSSRKMLMLK